MELELEKNFGLCFLFCFEKVCTWEKVKMYWLEDNNFALKA